MNAECLLLGLFYLELSVEDYEEQKKLKGINQCKLQTSYEFMANAWTFWSSWIRNAEYVIFRMLFRIECS